MGKNDIKGVGLKKLRGVWCFAIFLVAISGWNTQSAMASSKGFFDYNYYTDTRDFNVYTLNLLANVNSKIQYFSLLNIFNSAGTEENFDKSLFFSEQNIRWSVVPDLPYEMTLQWVTQSGNKNDIFRVGTRIRVNDIESLKSLFKKINLVYGINFHLLQFDSLTGYQWQIEHGYKIQLIKDLLYLAGFIDHNIDGSKHTLVTEHQVGYRMVDQLHIVAEYRFNGYLNKDRSGVGFGLQYLIYF